MKIDLSTIALILLAVLPGFCCSKVSNLLSPRSFAVKGPTEELASFVALSVFVHCLLVFLASAVAWSIGMANGCDPHLIFNWVDRNVDTFWTHKSLVIVTCCGYVAASCAIGGLIGFPVALLRLGGLARLWTSITQDGDLRSWLKRNGIRGLLGERPMIYNALSPELDALGNEQVVFLEAELKAGGGFYAGQVASYTVTKDEETHKLVLLRFPYYRVARTDEYSPVDCDQLMIDLADVLVLKVRAVPDPIQPQFNPQPNRG